MIRIILIMLVISFFGSRCWAAITIRGEEGAIHIPETAAIQEVFAAEQLQHYLHQASGLSVPVKKGPADKSAAAIVVCFSDHLKSMNEQPLSEELKLSIEGISNRLSGKHLLITGGGPRGVVYSAYNFLEHLGYRWYCPGEVGEVTPKLNATVIDDKVNVIHEPSFRRRHAMGGEDDGGKNMQRNLDAKDWLTKNRQNFWVQEVDYKDHKDFMKKRGGTYTKIGSGHNWKHIIKPEVYSKSHPEYFAMVNGKRSTLHWAQLCLSNSEVRAKLTDYALASAAEMVNDDNIMFVDMTQNDGHVWCECEHCKAIDDKDPDTRMDIVLWAMNPIAEKIAAEYPDAKIFLYAYSDCTTFPSWIKPHKKLLIELTNYCFNYGASFLNPDSGRGLLFKDHLDTWAKASSEFAIYEYYGFYNWLEAFPVTLYRLEEEINYYKKIGVRGFYSETEQRWSTNHLLYYAFSRLWWDHTTDVESMMDEFFRLFYGPAEKPMRDFYMALETSGGPGRYWSGDTFNLPQIFTKGIRKKCRKALNKAKQLAQDDTLIMKRLAFLELGWRYTELHLEAMEANTTFKASPTAEHKSKAMKAWQVYFDYFDRLEGTGAFAERELPNYKAMAKGQLDAYSLGLSSLGQGDVEYSDSLHTGGNARLHGKVTGFYDGSWGLTLRRRGQGSVTYHFAAEEGYQWSKAAVGITVHWREGVENALELSTDGKTWQTLFENSKSTAFQEVDISHEVVGKKQFWVRCCYKSSLDEDFCAVSKIILKGRIE